MKNRWMVGVVIFIIIVLCLAACVTAGRIVTEERRGDTMRRVTVQQPSKAVHPATLEQTERDKGKPGTFRASTGATQEVDQVGLRRTGIVTWSAVGLCIVGATLIVLRGWFPVIPISASIAALGVGVGLFWVPALIDRSPWLLLVVLGVIGVMYVTGGIDNWLKLRPRKPRPGEATPASTSSASGE